MNKNLKLDGVDLAKIFFTSKIKFKIMYKNLFLLNLNKLYFI